MDFILDLEVTGMMRSYKEPEPMKCGCGHEEFQPRLEDDSPDILMVCKGCGKVHRIKAEYLDSKAATGE